MARLQLQVETRLESTVFWYNLSYSSYFIVLIKLFLCILEGLNGVNR